MRMIRPPYIHYVCEKLYKLVNEQAEKPFLHKVLNTLEYPRKYGY